MFGDMIEKMEDGKEKQLMMLVKEDAKPFMRKCDGYAVKVSEDKEITYKDYNDQELTLKVPSGSYVVVSKDGCSPQIQTAEDFEKKNKMMGESKKEAPKKEDKGPSIGMALVSEEQDY